MYNDDMDNSFTIQQVAKMTRLSVHTLRYYEKIGLLQGVRRETNGYRLYSEADLAWIHFLIRLRATGMPISGMKRFSDLRALGTSTVKDRRELLEAHQGDIIARLQELQDHLGIIEEKIRYYRGLEEHGSHP